MSETENDWMKRTEARTKQTELDDTVRDEPESHTILGKINWSGIGELDWTSSLSAFRMFSLIKAPTA
jgi:hypothetical protein